jgi:hypothetical protein
MVCNKETLECVNHIHPPAAKKTRGARDFTMSERYPEGAHTLGRRAAPARRGRRRPLLTRGCSLDAARPGRQEEAVDERGSDCNGNEAVRLEPVASDDKAFSSSAAALREETSAPARLYFNGGAGLLASAGAGRPPGRSAGRPRPPLRLCRHRLAGRRRGRKEDQVPRRLGPRDIPRRPQLRHQVGQYSTLRN